jgi:hypothetical protein
MALAAGEAHAALAEKGPVAFRQALDELVGQGGAGRGLHRGIAGIGAAVADVFQGVGGEEGQHRGHGEQQQEILIDVLRIGTREAEVNRPAHD